MRKFKPTYLYIKQHSITGMLYFGKTSSRNPLKYTGSGVFWNAHIQQHGKQYIETIWHQLFTDEEECINFATNFSIDNDIVQSKFWANLIIEDGVGGGNSFTGKKHTEESINKMKLAQEKSNNDPEVQLRKKNGHNTKEYKEKQKLVWTGRKHSEDSINKMKAIHNSPEIVQRKREARKNYVISEETLIKMTAANRNITPNKRRAMKISHTKPCTIDGIIIYPSRGDMSLHLGKKFARENSSLINYIDLPLEFKWIIDGPFCLIPK